MFDKKQGLPQHEVTTITQDKMGYLWVGTNGGGVARFNGLQFEVFSEVADGVDNYITDIQFESDTLWIASRRGLIAQHNSEKLFYASLPLNKVCKVKDRVLVASQKGIRVLKDLTLTLQVLDPNLDIANVSDLVFDGNWYWATSNKGTFKFKWQQQKLVIHQVSKAKGIQIVLADKNVTIRGRQTITVFNKLKFEPLYNRELKGLQSIYYDSGVGNYVVVKSNDILRLSPDLSILQISKLQLGSKVDINNIFKDKNEQWWLATSKGLLKLHSNNFVQYLKGQSITAAQPFDQEVYIATSSGGLVLKDSLNNLRRIPNFNENSYAFAKKDSLLFSGTDTGVYMLYENEILDTITLLQNVQQLRTNVNELWVGSITEGIASFEIDSLRIQKLAHYTEKDGLYDVSISDMQFDSYGRLWYITAKKYLGYIENNIVHHLGQPLSTVVSLSTLTITNDHIYLGTQGDGVWVSSISSVKFRKLGGKTMKWPNVYQLYADAKNTLWVGTQNGAMAAVLSSPKVVESIEYFGRAEGFIGVETMQNAITPFNNGMLFGTIDGLMEYVPNNKQEISETPDLTINQIKIDHQEVVLDSSQIVRLTPEQNSLEVSYQTISVNNPSQISYSYQLDNQSWSDWSKQQSVVIPSLALGTYTLKIKSKIYEQESSIAYLKLIKKPYAYQTFWFQFVAMLVLILIIVITLVVFFGRRQRKLNQERKDLALNNKLLKLEQQALQLQMNPHFIFNVLNDIKANAQSDYKVMQQTIFDFAGLLRGVLEHSRVSEITLQQELDILGYYLKLEQHLSAKSFDYNIHLDSRIDSEETMIAPMLLQPFIENAIQHGISKLSSKGQIELQIILDNDRLKCTITDNGIGYIRSQKYKKANGHKSIAIKVTRERIKANFVHHKFEMEELKSETGDIVGTKVSFNMPYKTNF
ncbi:histidine kinase [Urechidicola sp. KH5]